MREDTALRLAHIQRIKDWSRDRGSEEFTATHVSNLLKITTSRAQSILRELAKEKHVTYTIEEHTNRFLYKARTPSLQSVPWTKMDNGARLGHHFP